MRDLITELRLLYHVDIDRIYLTGHSMGGFGTWALGPRLAEDLAAISPMAGGGGSIGKLVSTRTPVFIFHGADDRVVGPGSDRNLAKQLLGTDHDFVYTELDKVGHGFPASVQRELFEFFEPRRRYDKKYKHAWPRSSFLGKVSKDEVTYLGDPLAEIKGNAPTLKDWLGHVRLGGGRALGALTPLLEQRPEGGVAGLAKIVTSAGAPFDARAYAARALGAWGDAAGTSALRKAVALPADKAQSMVAREAAQALVKLKDADGTGGAREGHRGLDGLLREQGHERRHALQRLAPRDERARRSGHCLGRARDCGCEARAAGEGARGARAPAAAQGPDFEPRAAGPERPRARPSREPSQTLTSAPRRPRSGGPGCSTRWRTTRRRVPQSRRSSPEPKRPACVRASPRRALGATISDAMGRQDIDLGDSARQLRRFEERLIADADALERMLGMGVFETGVRRIGLEQEFFLIDENGRPAPRAMELLDDLGGDGAIYQTELARFNIEVAVPPQVFEGDCLTKVEQSLRQHMGIIRRAAHRHGVNVLAIGILPTLGWEHLTLDYMTPKPRYKALNDRVSAMRGGQFRIHIRGTDILHATHDNVLLESFNTSFQLHLQVSPDEFARVYNAMQLATCLAVAASGNSPCCWATGCGRRRVSPSSARAWIRARITTSGAAAVRGSSSATAGSRRVSSSSSATTSPRFRVVLPVDDEEPLPGKVLDEGGIPKLGSLALHNGTIYRWNRPCYGVADGVPHLRIENRPMPAGPTAVDSIANAALLFGLTLGLVEEYGDVSERMAFHDCKANFYNSASNGLRAALHWLDGRTHAADELVLLTLPLAAKGLSSAGVDEGDINRLLDLIGERVSSGRTGSRWMLDGFNRLRAVVPQDEALQSLVQGYLQRQLTGVPYTPGSLRRCPTAIAAERRTSRSRRS